MRLPILVCFYFIVIPATSLIGQPRMLNGVSVPSDFPVFQDTIIDSDSIANGKLFLNFRSPNRYILILENDGTPYFYERIKDPYNRYIHFQNQHNFLTRNFFENDEGGYLIYDTNFVVIDTFSCIGYNTDHHDFLYTKEQDAVLIGVEWVMRDLRGIIPDGEEETVVVSNNIQIQNKDKEVVFEWKGIDHFGFTDSYSDDVSSWGYDYIHINSVALDYDGNILISSRNLHECTKIRRSTGEIMWRLGGKNNQFNFINDTIPFAWQHDFRPVRDKPNCYRIFDNGDDKTRPFTRLVEYKIDTIHYTAEKIWEYRHHPDRFSPIMGNVQELENGNLLIDWVQPNLPKATEITRSGKVVYEGNFINPAMVYRTYKFDVQARRKTPYLIAEQEHNEITLIFNQFGDTNIASYGIWYGNSPDQFMLMDTASRPWYIIPEKMLVKDTNYYFAIRSRNHAGVWSDLSNIEQVYTRFYNQNENIIQNGEFLSELNEWDTIVNNRAEVKLKTEKSGGVLITIGKTEDSASEIQIIQDSILLIQHKKYRFRFEASANIPRIIDAKIISCSMPYSDYGRFGSTYITNKIETYEYEFIMNGPTDNNARVSFDLSSDTVDVFINNVSLMLDVEENPTYIKQSGLHSQQRLVNVFPNPARDKIIIGFYSNYSCKASVTIFTLNGQKIYQKNPERIQHGYHSLTGDIRTIANGNYILQLKLGKPENRIFRTKIMIHR